MIDILLTVAMLFACVAGGITFLGFVAVLCIIIGKWGRNDF